MLKTMFKKSQTRQKRKTQPATPGNIAVFLSELQEQTSPDAFSKCLQEWNFEPTVSLDGLHPGSDEYRQMVLHQYLSIRNEVEYCPAKDERDTVFDPSLGNPYVVYPYTTQDPILTGTYMVGVGLALRAMQLPPGSTIVEYGIGWGHTTLALAQLGYKVIAVDIEPKFLESVQNRAKHLGLNNVEVHCGEFGDLPNNSNDFDAVLFFECFHHCLNHVQVMGKLSEQLRPGGRMVFAGEPFFDSWYYPWGMRLDGQSVWAIATHGWMELGFQRSYFEQLLRNSGLTVERHCHKEFGVVGEVYVGIKRAG